MQGSKWHDGAIMSGAHTFTLGHMDTVSLMFFHMFFLEKIYFLINPLLMLD